MPTPSSQHNGWRYSPENSRLEMYYQGTLAGYITASGIFTAAAVATGSTADDVLFTLGTTVDIAQVLRSTILGANTALTGVIVGTPVTPAVAANSLIVANVTADGDLLLATQTGGNTHAAMWVDASAAITRFYSGAGVEILKLDSAAATLTGALTVAGSLIMSGAGHLSLGTPEAVTIATGVATVTRPIVALTGEGATTDTLDSITYTGVAAGDILILTVGALGYTITADNSATMLLGAGTRALVANSTLVLRYAGTTWIEVAFLTATA